MSNLTYYQKPCVKKHRWVKVIYSTFANKTEMTYCGDCGVFKPNQELLPKDKL